MKSKHVGKLLRPLVGSGLVLSGLAVTALPAAAAHIVCGSTITVSTTLTANIEGCTADGLTVTGSGITLNMNGKKILGANGAGDNAGIRLLNATGTTVKNGIVDGFDAGVVVMNGGGNTISSMIARNNINDLISPPCNLGEGIAIFDSSDNVIANNRALHNGPFGGISIVNNSDRNIVRSNLTRNNNIQGPGCGNPNQDEGIRVEGPGADGNVILNNTVEASLLAGIGLHGYRCNVTPPQTNEAPNQGTIVRGNTVSRTAGAQSAGIAFLEQGPPGVVCPTFNVTVKGNTSQNNEGDGIFVPANSANNTITGNTVTANGASGIFLGGPVIGNTFTDVGPSLLDVVTPDLPPFVEGATADFLTLSGSGSGDVTAPLVAVGAIFTPNTPPEPPAPDPQFDTATSGCLASDFVDFPVGAVALIQRGFCARTDKIANAVAAGASAVVFFNEGTRTRTEVLTAGIDPTTIPVVGTSSAVGLQLYNLTLAGPVIVHVVTNTTNVPFQVVPGATNNRVSSNFGRNNVEFDGADLTLTPPCDNNNWQANNFATVNQLCVQPTATVPPPAIPLAVGPLTGRSDMVDGANRGTVSSAKS